MVSTWIPAPTASLVLSSVPPAHPPMFAPPSSHLSETLSPLSMDNPYWVSAIRVVTHAHRTIPVHVQSAFLVSHWLPPPVPMPTWDIVHPVPTPIVCIATRPISTSALPATREPTLTEILVNLAPSPVLPVMKEQAPVALPVPQVISSIPAIIPVSPYLTHPAVEKIVEPAVVPVEVPFASIVLPDSSLPMDIASSALRPAASAASIRTR